jgi:hypothetical protein
MGKKRSTHLEMRNIHEILVEKSVDENYLKDVAVIKRNAVWRFALDLSGWAMPLCGLAGCYQHFGESYCPHFDAECSLKMEAVGSSETSVTTYHIKRRHKPEDAV